MASADSLFCSLATPHKAGELLIRPSHRPGDFDSHGADCPFVFSLDGRVGMTYVGWDGRGYQTALTWREDDGTWTEPEVVFARSARSRHRRHNAALTSIIRDNALYGRGALRRFDGWYYGTYHAYPGAGFETGPGVIGIVRSRDLHHWEEHGELLTPSTGAAWEQGGLYKSWLLELDGTFWLFYNAKNHTEAPWVEQTGAAVSTDLQHWERVQDTPVLPHGERGAADEVFASDPCVLHTGSEWVMFYFGLAADHRARDLVATSDDLLHWRKFATPLLDVGEPGSVDDKYAHKPAILYRDGVLEHYYCAVRTLADPVLIGDFVQDEMRGISVARSA